MIEVAIMVEGQNGLTWERWQRIARAAEELGFAGLYRSDHFTNGSPPNRESLELWVSLAWLASHTARIEFGPMVTPLSFRHPVWTARFGKDVDALSGGRLTLGVGAGWQEREHTMFGFDLLDVADRFDRFEEGVEVIHQLLHEEGPVDFHGAYYDLHEAELLPRPQRTGGPPLLIGGNGRNRTMPLAARFADEWNAIFVPPQEVATLNRHLDALLDEAGRPRDAVRRSMMTGLVFGRDGDELQAQLEGTGGRTVAQLRERGMVVGTPDEVVEQLGRYAEAGVQRVMLQWLALDDLERLEALAARVLPQL